MTEQKKKDVKKKISACDCEEPVCCSEWENKYKRALADYQNLLKQTAQEKSEFAKYANERFVQSVLPIYDNLKTALNCPADQVESNGWITGVKYVVKQFEDVLGEFGVMEIKTVEGQTFDPSVMEAIEGQGDQVEAVLRPGYKLHDRVIAPVKVKVVKIEEDSEETKEKEEKIGN